MSELLSDEPAPVEDTTEPVLLDFQARLADLRRDLAEAQAHAKRAEIDWREAVIQAQLQHEAAAALLRAGDRAKAQAVAAYEGQTRARIDEFSQRYHTCLEVAAQLQAAVTAWQAKLDDLRRQTHALAERERRAAWLEQINQAQRELRRKTFALSHETREAQVARREDRLAALRDFNE